MSDDELNTVTGGVKLTVFFGIIVPFPKSNQQAISGVNPDDQQIIGRDSPQKKDDEKYVM